MLPLLSHVLPFGIRAHIKQESFTSIRMHAIQSLRAIYPNSVNQWGKR